MSALSSATSTLDGLGRGRAIEGVERRAEVMRNRMDPEGGFGQLTLLVREYVKYLPYMIG